MNVLYLHRTQGQGVEGVHIWGIVNGLKKLGHNVKVLSPSGVQHAKSRKNKVAHSRTQKISFSGFISKHMPEILFEVAEIAYNFIVALSIWRVFKIFKPDLIYERYAIFAVAGMLMAKRLNIPLILEVNYTSQSPLVRKKTVLLKPLARMMDKFLFRKADAIIVVSTYLRDHLVVDYGINTSKILICPNAADPDIFSTKIKPIAFVDGVSLADKKVIGFVGTFSPWHGLDLFIDAFREVAEKVPDSIVLLIGEGPEKKAILRKVKNYNLHDRVVFAGSVEHEDLPAYISAFTLGVMPDSNDYGSPMKIFEYMSMGKPVVVPNYGPLLDAVEHKKNGMIFRRRKIESITQCIVEVLNDDELRNNLGKQARKCVITKFNWLGNARISLEFTCGLINRHLQ